MQKKSNVLNVAFSLGSIIDYKKAEKVFQEEGLDAFYSILEKHKNKKSIFSPGPSLGLFMALRKLNSSVPDHILNIKFGLVSRIDANPDIHAVIIDSMQHYIEENKDVPSSHLDNGFDLIAFTGGEDIFTFLGKKVFDADIMFTTSEESAKEFYSRGINCINIPNRSTENNIEMYQKRNGQLVFFTDFDGVIGDAKSEALYQESSKDKSLNPVEEFLNFEYANKDVPMELGPLGETIKKLSRVIDYQNKKKLTKDEQLLKIIVVTARNGQAMHRFNATLKAHRIFISQLYMMEGQNKNFLLGALSEVHKGKNLFFFDDSVIHFTRSTELLSISSGWIPNELNIL